MSQELFHTDPFYDNFGILKLSCVLIFEMCTLLRFAREGNNTLKVYSI